MTLRASNALKMRRLGSLVGPVGAALLVSACFGGGSGDGRGALGPSEGSARAVSARAPGVYKVGEPYQVAGVWYYPREDERYDQTGVASWYGREFGGKPTANGEIFDPALLTAAHTTLPMPSLVRVTNLENGRDIVVRVNDRGPFKRGRIIDLSEAAAERLGFRVAGVARVRVRYVGRAPVGDEGTERVAGVRTPSSARDSRSAPVGPVEGGRLEGAPPTYRAPPAVNPPVSTRDGAMGGDLWVQVGAFVAAANAERLRAELSRTLPARVVVAKVDGRRFHRVRIGPFRRIDEADRALDAVIAQGHPAATLIVE